jgi:RND family efflux transporter MFP subunit
MKRQTLVGVGVLAVAVIGCQGKKDPPPPPPPAVVVTPVVQRDVPVYGEWIGTTAGNDNAEIRPKVDGYLLRRDYAEGTLVQRGQLLFEIDPRQVQAQLAQAQANLAQGRAGLAKAERDVARFEPLAAQRAVSQQELDNARSALQAAQATVGSLQAAVDQARLSLTWTRVTSPIAGIAGTAAQQVGNLVSPSTVLTTVSQCDPIRVVYSLGEQEYLHLQQKLAQSPSSPAGGLELVLADGAVFPHPGRLLFADRQVDPRTGTIATVGLFPNPGNLLRPGQYAKVRAVVDFKKGALLVPQRAVNELQGGFQVAVVGSDDRAQVLPVAPGEKVGPLWVVENLPGQQPERALKAGDRVVVEGFSRIKPGALVRPQEAKPENALASAAGAPGGAAGAAASKFSAGSR